jgi:hypothetical protein
LIGAAFGLNPRRYLEGRQRPTLTADGDVYGQAYSARRGRALHQLGQFVLYGRAPNVVAFCGRMQVVWPECNREGDPFSSKGLSADVQVEHVALVLQFR